MDIRERVRSDEGRVPVGALVTLVVLAAAAAAAYFFLDQFGVWDSDDEISPTPVATAASPSPVNGEGPEWLTDPNRALPLLLNIDDERELPARLMEDWIWDFVDDDWELVLVRDGEGDGQTFLNNFQVLYLEAPDQERFRLWELRQDYDIEIVHWAPSQALAWLERGGRPGIAPVVELDLRTGESNTNWVGSAVPSDNNLPDGVGNVAYMGLQPNDRELWVAFDESGDLTGLFWRLPDGRFNGSVMNREIRRLRLEGFTEDRGVDAWINVESMTAVYRAADRIDGEVVDDRWFIHHLSNDDFELTLPQVPDGADCRPQGDLFTSGQFDGERILAMCRVGNTNTGTYLDPTGDNPPE